MGDPDRNRDGVEHGLELRGPRLQGLLGSAALRDVAEGRLDGQAIIELDASTRGLDRERRAVEAAEDELGRIDAVPGALELAHSSASEIHALLHDLLEQGSAQEKMWLLSAEQVGSGAIGEDDLALSMNQNRIGPGFDQGPVALLALLQGYDGPTSFGDVGEGADAADGSSGFVEIDAASRLDPPLVPVARA